MPTACCRNETCSDCQFWLEIIGWAENGTVPGRPDTPIARVDGWHYVAKPTDTTTPPQYLGFGGLRFTFRFHDGREVTSNDVMCQGAVPDRFRDRLPDNAVIVPQEPARTKVPFGSLEGLT